MTPYAAYALCPEVRHAYERGVDFYHQHCRQRELPEALTVLGLVTALARKADESGPAAAQALLAALRWHAQRTGGYECTTQPEVLDVMDGIRRTLNPGPRPRYTDDDVADFLRPLGAAPLDRRDRALALAVHELRLPFRVLRTLRRPDLAFTEHTLAINVGLWKRELFASHRIDGAGCVVCALAAWLAVPGPQPDGYVFVGRNHRGGFFESAIRCDAITHALQRTAFLARGVPTAISVSLLRASSIEAAPRDRSIVLLSYTLGFRSVCALRRYGYFDSRGREHRRSLHRFRRRRWQVP